MGNQIAEGARWLYLRWALLLLLMLSLYMGLRWTLIIQESVQHTLEARHELDMMDVRKIEEGVSQLQKNVATMQARQHYFKVGVDKILFQQAKIMEAMGQINKEHAEHHDGD